MSNNRSLFSCVFFFHFCYHRISLNRKRHSIDSSHHSNTLSLEHLLQFVMTHSWLLLYFRFLNLFWSCFSWRRPYFVLFYCCLDWFCLYWRVRTWRGPYFVYLWFWLFNYNWLWCLNWFIFSYWLSWFNILHPRSSIRWVRTLLRCIRCLRRPYRFGFYSRRWRLFLRTVFYSILSDGFPGHFRSTWFNNTWRLNLASLFVISRSSSGRDARLRWNNRFGLDDLRWRRCVFVYFNRFGLRSVWVCILG